MKPRVAWVSFAALRKTPGGWTSDVASARYRMTIPARALGDLGCDSVIVDAGPQADPSRLLKRVSQVDAAIFGKLVAPPEQFVAQAPKILQFVQALRGEGVRVLADFSDDSFQEPLRGPYFRGLSNLADAVIASTEGLADILREETPAPVFVVTDPVEGERGVAAAWQADSDRPLQLLWYGHPTNLDTLGAGLVQIDRLASRVPVEVTLVTTPGAVAQAWAAKVKRLVPWSTRAVFDELRACDAVFIPSVPEERRRAIKSPNRFTEATWAGRFVIAHPLPSYDALSAYGWVGTDIGAGVEWLTQNPARARERIQAGQAEIETSFTPQAVGQQWKAAILPQR